MEPINAPIPVTLTPSTPVDREKQAFVRELAITISLARAFEDAVQALKKTKHLFEHSS